MATKGYKRGCGLITMRGPGGKFRKTTLEDFGIMDANKELATYICNVCGNEFIPVLHSGKCCGVDNKRLKVIVVSKEKQAIIDKIQAIRSKPFINRFHLEEIQALEWELKKTQ